MHVPKHRVRPPEVGICQWALEQMALGIWPEQELSIPTWSNRCVIKSVPLSEKCWIKGIQKKDLKFLPKTVLNLQDNISSLHLYYLKITRNDIRIFQYPELVFFLLIHLEKEGIVQISYSSHLISKPAWFCLKKEGLSYALPTPHHV